MYLYLHIYHADQIQPHLPNPAKEPGTRLNVENLEANLATSPVASELVVALKQRESES